MIICKPSAHIKSSHPFDLVTVAFIGSCSLPEDNESLQRALCFIRAIVLSDPSCLTFEMHIRSESLYLFTSPLSRNKLSHPLLRSGSMRHIPPHSQKRIDRRPSSSIPLLSGAQMTDFSVCRRRRGALRCREPAAVRGRGGARSSLCASPAPTAARVVHVHTRAGQVSGRLGSVRCRDPGADPGDAGPNSGTGRAPAGRPATRGRQPAPGPAPRTVPDGPLPAGPAPPSSTSPLPHQRRG